MHLMPDDLISVHNTRCKRAVVTNNVCLYQENYTIAAPITLSSPIRNAITKEAKK